MHRILSTLVFTLILSLAFAQLPDSRCGMNKEEADMLIKMTAEAKALAEKGELTKSGEITWVPVKWHLVGQNNGSGRVADEEVFQQMCSWNDFYADQEIQFYIDGGTFNYINSTPAYTNPREGGGLLALQGAKQQFGGGRMNVFVVQNAGDIEDGDGDPTNNPQSAGYYSPQWDWIVVRNSDVLNSNETINHEAGHFFSLSHTFRGWDFFPYNEAVHGNPAPVFSPQPNVRTEAQDRQGGCANCSTAGDLLCDTWPDYQLSTNYHTGNCDYNGQIMDPCGVLVEPTRENTMSYFFGCDQTFSSQQKGLISASLNLRRNQGTINRSLVPQRIADVEPGFELISPLEGESLPFNNVAHLDWENVPGATHYLVYVDRFSSFGVQQEEYYVDYSGLTLYDLSPNDEYFWKVHAFNSTSTCAGWSPTNSFNTGDGATAVESIKALTTWSLSPNPVHNQNEVTLRMRATDSFEGLISIRDITGKTLMERSERLNTGDNTIQLNTSTLENGIYVVSINNGDAVSTKKLIVAN